MGCFPYNCLICGGGYKRCGNKDCEDKNCRGGQFCYEDECYFVPEKYYLHKLANNLIKIHIEGIYNEYGGVKVDWKDPIILEKYKDVVELYKDKIFISIYERDNLGYEESQNKDKIILGYIYCKSCFESEKV